MGSKGRHTLRCRRIITIDAWRHVMNWLVRSLVGAVVAGLGWKLGSDAYEAIKKRVKKHVESDKKPEENGAGVTQTGAATVGDAPATPPSESRR
jgi:hypothetical protein